MDDLNAIQARDHLELVERILAESQQRLCAGGEYFVVWGLFSGGTTILLSLIGRGTLPPAAVWVAVASWIACILFSIFRGRRLHAKSERQSLVQREFFNVLWLTIGLAFVANVAAYRVFAGLASAAVWSFAGAIVLLYIGMHGNRRAQIAGVVVVVSIVVANFVGTPSAAYALAAGMIVGYAGFGLVELVSRG
ncbi:MAG TPA: hypothetical protein VGF86_08470 [Candidatus Tumulicola sp.]|jgi:hypothetical protein